VELAVVIGKKGRYIPKGLAMDHVAGYTVFNDISDSSNSNFGFQNNRSCLGGSILKPFRRLVVCKKEKSYQRQIN
jgi:hypothetical protein